MFLKVFLNLLFFILFLFPCIGDSGGPLLTLSSDGVWYLYGITSFGSENGCALEATPTAYTRVTSFLQYIFDVTGVRNAGDETLTQQHICTESAKEELPKSLMLDSGAYISLNFNNGIWAHGGLFS